MQVRLCHPSPAGRGGASGAFLGFPASPRQVWEGAGHRAKPCPQAHSPGTSLSCGLSVLRGTSCVTSECDFPEVLSPEFFPEFFLSPVPGLHSPAEAEAGLSGPALSRARSAAATFSTTPEGPTWNLAHRLARRHSPPSDPCTPPGASPAEHPVDTGTGGQRHRRRTPMPMERPAGHRQGSGL